MTPSNLESWAYLSRVIEGPSRHLQEMLRAGRDADEIARGIRTRASWLGPLAGTTERRYDWDRPVADLETAHEHGYRLLTPEHAGWPSERIEESFVAGALHSRENMDFAIADGSAPHALWVRGATDLAALVAQSVAFVGTRASSSYGHQATQDLVGSVAKQRYTVVSGGAIGIDTVAHETALAAGAPTIAVAACGPGVVYPKRNEKLFRRIVAAGGALVTEYPPGVTPDRHRFLTRNRLVAGLTQGSVVVEAAFRSGALNTLKWARYYNRQAMAVPGSILGPNSLGTNLAIRAGNATMVLSGDQIHEQCGHIGQIDAEGQLEMQFQADPIQQLSHNELRVFDATPPAASAGRDAERIAADAGLSTGLTVHLLMELERRGLVQRERRQWSRAVRSKESA
ncbi:DNA processing protein DprA [Corynebacterium sp. NML 150383]|uniref:DNA-processing protein DprA n=1 Tax=Corynebacterium sp. NML 150383 TaxID=2029400 RepID=UPI000BAA4B5F|nr:DNA-processing protein DprA [Corynebacterium sp. NML 150383]PAT03552.1 DNA processing protein DprA [Corynebacterium sp. NML 150383]